MDTQQIVTPEFADWLYEPDNDFNRVFSPGDAWDTDTAWPDPNAMISARICFTVFAEGELAKAKEYLHRAVAIPAPADKAERKKMEPADLSAGHTTYQVTNLCFTKKIKLTDLVIRTPLGFRTTVIRLIVDLEYHVDEDRIVVTKVCLTHSQSLGLNVVSHRGEAFKAPPDLERILNERALPAAIDRLIAKDEQVRGMLLRRAGIYPASEKQKAFAHKLHIAFNEDISSKAISKLIEQKLLESHGKG